MNARAGSDRLYHEERAGAGVCVRRSAHGGNHCLSPRFAGELWWGPMRAEPHTHAGPGARRTWSKPYPL